jgi:hypothetical protein
MVCVGLHDSFDSFSSLFRGMCGWDSSSEPDVLLVFSGVEGIGVS